MKTQYKRPFVTRYFESPDASAMRCYVASKLNDEIAVPDELIYDKGDE